MLVNVDCTPTTDGVTFLTMSAMDMEPSLEASWIQLSALLLWTEPVLLSSEAELSLFSAVSLLLSLTTALLPVSIEERTPS